MSNSLVYDKYSSYKNGEWSRIDEDGYENIVRKNADGKTFDAWHHDGTGPQNDYVPTNFPTWEEAVYYAEYGDQEPFAEVSAMSADRLAA